MTVDNIENDTIDHHLDDLDEEHDRLIEELIESGVLSISWDDINSFRFYEKIMKVLEKEKMEPKWQLAVSTKILCSLSLYISICITNSSMETGPAGLTFFFSLFLYMVCIYEMACIHEVISRNWGYCQELERNLFDRSDTTKYDKEIKEIRKRVIKLDNNKNILNIIYLLSNAFFFLIFLISSVYIGWLRYMLGVQDVYLDVVLNALASIPLVLCSVLMLKNYALKHWWWLRKMKNEGSSSTI